MAAASSTMLDLSTPIPAFSLPDTLSEQHVTSSQLLGAPALVVAFVCNHCPYVKHILPELVEFGRECSSRGVRMVGISSNDETTYPEDAPAKMTELGRAMGFTFPYLYDANQSVAKAFRAMCTPEFYVFDKAGKLAYRGQFDDSRPGNGKPVTGRDVRAAVDALLAGKSPDERQVPSIGCSIKWKAGHAPKYT
jgi:peroxiredoxin